MHTYPRQWPSLGFLWEGMVGRDALSSRGTQLQTNLAWSLSHAGVCHVHCMQHTNVHPTACKINPWILCANLSSG